MSQDNVEIARRAIDAFNRRDFDGYDDLYAPDFEWFPAILGIVEGGSFRGREGSEAFLEDINKSWEEFRILADELRDFGERVLLLGRIEGRGRGSGVQVDSAAGLVFDFRDGKISRSHGYLDHDQALRAAAPSE